MQKIKFHISRFIILIVALQLVNLRIQAHPTNEVMLAHSFDGYNRIDNAVEYILEVLLQKKDAIPEDRRPKQDHTFHAKNIDIKLIVPQYSPIEPTLLTMAEQQLHFPRYKIYTYGFSTEINPPPPKA